MGMTATAIGLGMGALSTASSLMGSAQTASQQRAQASALESQAAETARQARLAEQKGRLEAENIDRQKSQIRREYAQKQAHNRALLAAGNVDSSSGSALDVQYGNADAFAIDLAENKYQVDLKQWETNENVKALNWQAEAQNSQASYLKRTADNVGPNLVTAGLAGIRGFDSGYSMAGGILGGGGGDSIGTDLSDPIGKLYHQQVKSNWVCKI